MLTSSLLFSQLFSNGMKFGILYFFDFCKWNVLLPLSYGAACPQNRFCKCRAQDDNGGLKCDANMVASWREKQHLSWLLLTAHDNMWWITHAGLSKRTAAGLLGRPNRQSETAKIFWVSWRDKILEWRRSKSRCGNAQTNNRARPHEVNIRSHMQKSLVCWHMQTHHTEKYMHIMNAILNAKHTPVQFYSYGMYEYSNKAYILIFESAANCFSFALAGVNEYTESRDRKYTAHLSVLSRPALHLVKACLSKPI